MQVEARRILTRHSPNGHYAKVHTAHSRQNPPEIPDALL